jgi:hypothetical protein
MGIFFCLLGVVARLGLALEHSRAIEMTNAVRISFINPCEVKLLSTRFTSKSTLE